MIATDTRVAHVLAMGDETDDFNCWGATLYVARAMNSLRWVEQDEMMNYLMTHGTPIKQSQIKEGDILAMFQTHPFDSEKRRLVHTAVYLGNGKYLHKQGRNVAAIATLKEVRAVYSMADCGAYIRPERSEI